MTPQSENIPLFPLHLVLFPGSFIPLHIYEERYKELISSCMEKKSYFGINLVEGNNMCTVGCTARVVEVLQTYEDGRMDIVVSGGRRYRLLNIDEHSSTVLNAMVEYFDDEPDGTVQEEVFEECVALYNKIVDVVFHGKGELTLQDGVAGAAQFSFFMAQKAGLQLSQKQELLESRSEQHRLTQLLMHMKELLPTISKAEQINNVVRSDGYFIRNTSSGF